MTPVSTSTIGAASAHAARGGVALAAAPDPAELLHRALTQLSALGAARSGGVEARAEESATSLVGEWTRASLGGSPRPAAAPPSADDGALRDLSSALGMSSDPVLVLLGITESLRGNQADEQRDRLAVDTRSSEVANREQRTARRRSERASRRARRWLARAPKWAKRLVTGLIAAAGLAAAAFTGGAALGLAVAGTVLTLSADHIATFAKRHGMSPKAAKILGALVQVAGAALSASSGLASGPARLAATAGQSVASAVRTAEHVTSAVQGALQAVQGARGIGASVLTHHAAEADRDAERAGVAMERAHEDVSEVVDAMRRTSSAFQSASERLVDIADVQRRRDDAIVAGIGR